MKLTSEENRTIRAKLNRSATIYGQSKAKDEQILVDPTTLRNLSKKGILSQVK